MAKWYAYQVQHKDGKEVRVVYGEGESPSDAIWNARYVVRDGQTWQRQYAPPMVFLKACIASEIDGVTAETISFEQICSLRPDRIDRDTFEAAMAGDQTSRATCARLFNEMDAERQRGATS